MLRRYGTLLGPIILLPLSGCGEHSPMAPDDERIALEVSADVSRVTGFPAPLPDGWEEGSPVSIALSYVPAEAELVSTDHRLQYEFPGNEQNQVTLRVGEHSWSLGLEGVIVGKDDAVDGLAFIATDGGDVRLGFDIRDNERPHGFLVAEKLPLSLDDLNVAAVNFGIGGLRIGDLGSEEYRDIWFRVGAASVGR